MIAGRPRTARSGERDLRLAARLFRDRSAKYLGGRRDEDGDLTRSRIEIDGHVSSCPVEVVGGILERDLEPAVMLEVVLPQTAPRCDPQHGRRNVGEVPGANDLGFRRSLALSDDHRRRRRLVHAIDAAVVSSRRKPCRPRSSIATARAVTTSGARSTRAGAVEQVSGSVTAERTIWSVPRESLPSAFAKAPADKSHTISVDPIVASVPRPVLGRRPATPYHEWRSRLCSLSPASVVTATRPFESRRASCRTPASTPALGDRKRHDGVEAPVADCGASDASGRASRYRRAAVPRA